MKFKSCFPAFLWVACIVVMELTACTPQAPDQNSTLTDTASLHQALTSIPDGSQFFSFINWGYIKNQEGFNSLTSNSNREEWKAFFTSVIKRYSVLNAFGTKLLAEHADMWGWDSADLEWEASVWGDQPPGYILKLRNGFDFGPVLAHFEERGFAKSEYAGIPIYTHLLETDKDWVRRSDFAILHTAILTDNNILIMSVNYQAMIDAYQKKIPSLADDPAVQAVVRRIGKNAEAFISADPCSAFGSEALKEKDSVLSILSTESRPTASQVTGGQPLQRYEALGISYRYENQSPVGLIVMHFPNAEQANTDLSPRRQLVDEGQTSGSKPMSYAEAYFTLTTASAEGNDIVFEISPAHNLPRWFFQMIARRDLSFATCP